MKKIAFYLPQFHVIPENDEWWGEGFTEWTNVKKASPLFQGHSVPEIPLNKNYYNLLDKETLENQSGLATKYGIDAFCYYHYWFDGKLLLEKPMEMMLNNENINIEFCVCWANESWARTWDGKDTHTLIKQNYCESKEGWKNHYKYLSPFFKDKRYLKENNKPLVILYKPHLIENLAEFMRVWENLAKKDGFDGIKWGYQHPSSFKNKYVVESFDFGIEFEPLYTKAEMDGEKAYLSKKGKIKYALSHPLWTMNKMINRFRKMPTLIDYDVVWERILNRVPCNNNICPGAFPAWDNTPRKGSNGIVYYESTPEKFKFYFQRQLKRASDVYQAEYIFINAWNEWGEGAHLEPDERNAYGYLEAIRNKN